MFFCISRITGRLCLCMCVLGCTGRSGLSGVEVKVTVPLAVFLSMIDRDEFVHSQAMCRHTKTGAGSIIMSCCAFLMFKGQRQH